MNKILQLILAQYVMGYLLQSIICVLAVCAINKNKIEIKLFSAVTIIFCASVVIIRLLPIAFGVHTLLNLIILATISTTLLKNSIYKSVLSSIAVGIMSILTEFLNISFLGLIFGFNNIDRLFNNELNKAITGIPANIFFLVVVLIIYKLLEKPKNEEKRNTKVDS